MQSKVEELKAKYEAAFRVVMAKAKAADEADRASQDATRALRNADNEAAEIGRELFDAIREEAMIDVDGVDMMGLITERHGTPVTNVTNVYIGRHDATEKQ